MSKFFNLDEFTSRKRDLESLTVDFDCGKFRISIRTYDFIRFDRITRNTLHKHDIYEMGLVISGNGKYEHGGKIYSLKSGDLFIAEPEVIHEISSIRTKDLYLVFLLFYIRESGIRLTGRSEDIIISNFLKAHSTLVPGAGLLFNYLPLLLADNGTQPVSRQLSKEITTKAWIFDCLTQLTLNADAEAQSEELNQSIEKAVSYVYRNIGSRITVADIAEHACVSERHMRHLFRKHYDIAVTEFVQKEKIKYAENKLRLGVKINKAAEFVGIHNSSQFSKLFKKYTGVSPRQYRDLFNALK